MKFFKALLFILPIVFLLSGCSEVQIFEDPSLKGKMVAVKDKDLEMDTFYVKSGTDFFTTVPLRGTENVKYAEKYVDTTIPTCYKGEILVQSAKKSSFAEVSLQRFRDMGYGPGLFDAYTDAERNEVTFVKRGVQKESDFYKLLDKLESDSIRLLGVQGNAIDSTHVSPNTGIIYNFNKDDEVKITLYAGTYYHEVHTVADTELFEKMEDYVFDESYIEDTQNGYRCFTMPDTMKPGYYLINGFGMFRYVDYKRGEGDPDKTDYNILGNRKSVSGDESTRQYSINLDNDMANLRIAADYDGEQVPEDETIYGKVLSPDGTEYDMSVDTENHRISIDLTEATTGRWQVNIFPQDLPILNMSAENITPTQELTEETFNIVTTDTRKNIKISSFYDNINGRDQDNKVTVTGSVIDPDGQTYIMQQIDTTRGKHEHSGSMEAAITYAPQGEYKVIINHYPDETTILEPEVLDNQGDTPDTIVIEE